MTETFYYYKANTQCRWILTQSLLMRDGYRSGWGDV